MMPLLNTYIPLSQRLLPLALLTGTPHARHPTGKDRTWHPARLRHRTLTQLVRNSARSSGTGMVLGTRIECYDFVQLVAFD